MSFWTKLSDSFQPPMFAAVKEGDLEKVRALLQGNPDLVSKEDNTGWTPLHYAVHWGRKGVVELLLSSHADLNAQANDGITPLHCAVGQGYKDVAELLLANHAEVNAKDNELATPLHYAADEGREDIVKLLLSSNADFDANDNDGNTPLRLAVSKGHLAVAELLRQRSGHEWTLLKNSYRKDRTPLPPLVFAARLNQKPNGEQVRVGPASQQRRLVGQRL